MATTCVSSRACSGCATEGIAALVALTTLVGAAAWIAVGQRNEARRQAAIAQAGRLSVQADQLRERGGPTDASVMLAVEALRLLDGISERSADVDQSLRRALLALPQAVGSTDVSGQDFRLTPDGTRLMTTRLAEQAAAHAVPSGRPVGCQREDIERAPGANPPGRLWRIQAVSDDGAWCVVHVYFDDGRATTSSFGRPIRSDSSPPSRRLRWPDMWALQVAPEASGSPQQTGRKWATPPVRSSASGRFARTVQPAPFRPFPA